MNIKVFKGIFVLYLAGCSFLVWAVILALILVALNWLPKNAILYFAIIGFFAGLIIAIIAMLDGD